MVFPSELPIPPEVLRIVETLEGAGHETWCVGGAVRDNLLGLDNKDFDLATAARPDEVQRLFRRTVPIGVEHGTVGVLDRDRQVHEVTTFRRDVRTDGRHAVVEFGASLDDDLARRDFTINAIAFHAQRREWRDPFDGASDLERGVIRAVGDAGQRFREDYLRILRALRFGARFAFEIEADTWAAAVAHVEGLRGLSAERVREEWMRGLATAKSPSALVASWGSLGALDIWLPEASATDDAAGERAGAPSRLDRFGERDPVLMTAFLSADPERTLDRLRCSRAEIRRGKAIGEWRGEEPDGSSDIETRRWMARVGPAVDDLLALLALEGWGAELAGGVERARAAKVPLRVADLAVSGDDLKAQGFPAGPELGRVLGDLLERVLEDPARNDRSTLLRIARERRASASKGG